MIELVAESTATRALIQLLASAAQRDKFTFLPVDAPSELRLLVELALAASLTSEPVDLPPTIVTERYGPFMFSAAPACHGCGRPLPDPRRAVHAGGRFLLDILCPCGHQTLLCSLGWPKTSGSTGARAFFWVGR